MWRKGYAASYRGGRAGACAMSITSRQRLMALGMSLRLSLSFLSHATNYRCRDGGRAVLKAESPVGLRATCGFTSADPGHSDCGFAPAPRDAAQRINNDDVLSMSGDSVGPTARIFLVPFFRHHLALARRKRHQARYINIKTSGGSRAKRCLTFVGPFRRILSLARSWPKRDEDIVSSWPIHRSMRR
jgi:hypothetical protein